MATINVDVSAIVDSTGIDASDVLTPLGDLKDAVESILEGAINFEKVGMAAPSLVTVSSGVITVAQLRHRVETEGSASSDIVDTITGSQSFVILSLNSSGQTLIFKHNTGNLWFDDGRDFVVSNQSVIMVFWWNPVTSRWSAASRNTGDIWLKDTVNAMISGDAVTLTQTKARLTSESGTSDNLATVNTPASPNALDMIVLTAAATHTITLKHNTGNIYMPSGRDYALTGNDTVLLVWNDVGSKWVATGLDYQVQTLERVENVLGVGDTFDKLIFPPNLIRALGGNDVAIDAQPRLGNRRIAYDQLVTGTTFSSFGATLSNFGNAPAAYEADTAYADYVTSGVSGNAAGRRSASMAELRWNPLFEAVIGFQTAPVNMPGTFVGLMAGTPTPSAYAGVSGVFLHYYYGASKWLLHVYNNGTALIHSGNNIGVVAPLVTATRFRIRIWVDIAAATVYVSVNDSAPVSSGALPLAGWQTVKLDMVAGALATSSGASSIAVSRMYLEQD